MKTPEEIAEKLIIEWHNRSSLFRNSHLLKRSIAKAIAEERLERVKHICIHHSDSERAANSTCPVCLRTRVKALEDGLRPFAESVARKREAHGNKSRQKWFDEMPGHWPLENISVTMADGRRALALLADAKEGG